MYFQTCHQQHEQTREQDEQKGQEKRKEEEQQQKQQKQKAIKRPIPFWLRAAFFHVKGNQLQLLTETLRCAYLRQPAGQGKHPPAPARTFVASTTIPLVVAPQRLRHVQLLGSTP